MVKRRKARATKLVSGEPPRTELAANDQINTSNLSLHELFEQQAAEMLVRADIDEEQKQAILVAMSCPCCGAGGMSLTVRLKRKD
jgi:hypothetical protein